MAPPYWFVSVYESCNQCLTGLSTLTGSKETSTDYSHFPKNEKCGESSHIWLRMEPHIRHSWTFETNQLMTDFTNHLISWLRTSCVFDPLFLHHSDAVSIGPRSLPSMIWCDIATKCSCWSCCSMRYLPLEGITQLLLDSRLAPAQIYAMYRAKICWNVRGSRAGLADMFSIFLPSSYRLTPASYRNRICQPSDSMEWVSPSHTWATNPIRLL